MSLRTHTRVMSFRRGERKISRGVKSVLLRNVDAIAQASPLLLDACCRCGGHVKSVHMSLSHSSGNPCAPSEDFECMFRMQALGYTSSYVGARKIAPLFDCFLEGESINFEAEEQRYVKFAWGAAELVFNPLTMWMEHGMWAPPMRIVCGGKVHRDSHTAARMVTWQHNFLSCGPFFMM